MKTNQYLSIVSNWRKTWSTKSKLLSIKGCTTEEEVIKVAIDKAHQPSVQRALKLEEDCSTKKDCSTKIPRQKAKEYLLKEIPGILHETNITFADYEKWAEKVCTEIRKIYREDNGIKDYTFGNAQKLLSMTVKYILSAENIDPTLPIFDVAYIPIDGKIMKIAKKKLKVKSMPESWSKTDNFKDIADYEKRLRKDLPSGYSLVMWEIENWKS